jgi:hypothetical protein
LAGKVRAGVIVTAARPFLVAAGRLAAQQDEPMEALAAATLTLATPYLVVPAQRALFCLSTKP